MAEIGVERTGQGLAAGDQGPSPPSSITIVLLVIRFWFFLDERFHDMFDIANFYQNVFGFQIGVDDAAFAMQII